MQKNIGRYDTDTIRLLNCFVRRNDDDGGHCWTELTRRHRHDRCRERRKRERAKRRIAGRYRERPRRAGGRLRRALLYGCRTDGRVRRYRKLRALTTLRPHVRIRITAPCPRRTSGLISRRHAGLHRPSLAAPWHTTASSAQYKVSKRGW